MVVHPQGESGQTWVRSFWHHFRYTIKNLILFFLNGTSSSFYSWHWEKKRAHSAFSKSEEIFLEITWLIPIISRWPGSHPFLDLSTVYGNWTSMIVFDQLSRAEISWFITYGSCKNIDFDSVDLKWSL